MSLSTGIVPGFTLLFSTLVILALFILNFILCLDQSLIQSFAQAKEDHQKRALKCEIVNEKIVETDSIPPSSDAIADFEKVREYFKGFFVHPKIL